MDWSKTTSCPFSLGVRDQGFVEGRGLCDGPFDGRW